MSNLIDDLELKILNVSLAVARRVADTYAQWAKGVRRAKLKLGDCFAYETAKTRDCPLPFSGADFARTNIANVL